jgi:hypothetical protein
MVMLFFGFNHAKQGHFEVFPGVNIQNFWKADGVSNTRSESDLLLWWVFHMLTPKKESG